MKIPAGTTEKQWLEYEADRKEFEAKMRAIEPKKDDPAYSEWHRTYFMDAPNKPGYYRANND